MTNRGKYRARPPLVAPLEGLRQSMRSQAPCGQRACGWADGADPLRDDGGRRCGSPWLLAKGGTTSACPIPSACHPIPTSDLPTRASPMSHRSKVGRRNDSPTANRRSAGRGRRGYIPARHSTRRMPEWVSRLQRAQFPKRRTRQGPICASAHSFEVNQRLRDCHHGRRRKLGHNPERGKAGLWSDRGRRRSDGV
jgi:hypothetical protein